MSSTMKWLVTAALLAMLGGCAAWAPGGFAEGMHSPPIYEESLSE